MDQQQFWNEKWQKGEYRPRSNFARRSYHYLADKNYHTLLDLGCGNGNDAIYFTHKGFEVTAIDISDAALDQFRQRKEYKNIKIYQANLTHLTLPNNSFDVIYANLSLHYFDEVTTQEIFSTLYEVLKPGGTILVKCKSLDDDRNGKTNRFYNFFSRDSMRKYLTEFKIIKIRKTSSVYNQYKSNFIEAIATK